MAVAGPLGLGEWLLGRDAVSDCRVGRRLLEAGCVGQMALGAGSLALIFFLPTKIDARDQRRVSLHLETELRYTAAADFFHELESESLAVV